MFFVHPFYDTETMLLYGNIVETKYFENTVEQTE